MSSALMTLSKSFRHTHAVEKLNLEIPEGAIFALVGPNGAGKTTAIKTLMNILSPERRERRGSGDRFAASRAGGVCADWLRLGKPGVAPLDDG